MRNDRRRAGIFAALGIASFVAGVVLVLAPGAQAAQGEKVTICHRTNSVTNPYTVNSVSVSAIDGSKKNDHSHHLGPVFDFSDPGQYTPPFSGDEWGDIIPPHAVNGNVGQNWDVEAWEGGPTGAEIHAAGCQEPPETTTTAGPETADLTVVKVVTGAVPETWSFDFTIVRGEEDLGEFSLSDDAPDTQFLDLPTDAYTITELVPEGVTLVDVDCGEGVQAAAVEDGITVGLPAGGDVTCTFTDDVAETTTTVEETTTTVEETTTTLETEVIDDDVTTTLGALDETEVLPNSVTRQLPTTGGDGLGMAAAGLLLMVWGALLVVSSGRLLSRTSG